MAIAPVGAPPEVVAVIAAANEIVGKPYKYGGGHGDWEDSGYDCSGSESYALHGADLVSRPVNSSEFMSWGEPGAGQWITSYAHGGHSFLVVAGLRFDTGYNDSSAPARSGRTRCARRTASPSVTPKVSSSARVLAVTHDRAFFDDRPVARASRRGRTAMITRPMTPMTIRMIPTVEISRPETSALTAK